MSGLLEEFTAQALAKNIPLGVHMDLTYRCNERKTANLVQVRALSASGAPASRVLA